MPPRAPSLSSSSSGADRASDGRGGLPAKLYFRIGEVADLVGVEPHVLRYWEREFRTIRPSKSAKGQRVYSQKDVAHLMQVRDLLYTQGFTIAGAKKQIHEGADAELAPSAPSPSTAPSPRPRGRSAFVPELGPLPAYAHAAHATAALPVGTAPAPVVAPPALPSRVRAELLAMRDEIEAFLQDLDVN